ncbi:hypothetical protein KP509_37G069500 [Ceratopteris richardii]|uniref:TCP domain-containing protein n=1 Tax=Ceratopteris richardii TaxID=49495 RepID=A0A8T2Q8S5_CERRI|nr:hypothetical protein KP509_37G069500 [Ceratopteris richardii]
MTIRAQGPKYKRTTGEDGNLAYEAGLRWMLRGEYTEESAGARTIRQKGGKDRHSKVFTWRGARDRRVRLSVGTAIRFYDLQDRLGFDQPSKAVDWLLLHCQASIRALPQLHARPPPPSTLERLSPSAQSTISVAVCSAQPRRVSPKASPSIHGDDSLPDRAYSRKSISHDSLDAFSKHDLAAQGFPQQHFKAVAPDPPMIDDSSNITRFDIRPETDLSYRSAVDDDLPQLSNPSSSAGSCDHPSIVAHHHHHSNIISDLQSSEFPTRYNMSHVQRTPSSTADIMFVNDSDTQDSVTHPSVPYSGTSFLSGSGGSHLLSKDLINAPISTLGLQRGHGCRTSNNLSICCLSRLTENSSAAGCEALNMPMANAFTVTNKLTLNNKFAMARTPSELDARKSVRANMDSAAMVQRFDVQSTGNIHYMDLDTEFQEQLTRSGVSQKSSMGFSEIVGEPIERGGDPNGATLMYGKSSIAHSSFISPSMHSNNNITTYEFERYGTATLSSVQENVCLTQEAGGMT